MKLKYKKIILLTSLCTMGIGLLTLSISQDKPKAEEHIGATSSIVSDETESNDGDSIVMSAMEASSENTEDEAMPLVTLTPTPIPTPTPTPVYPLEEIESMD